jgi:hypothetical protein
MHMVTIEILPENQNFRVLRHYGSSGRGFSPTTVQSIARPAKDFYEFCLSQKLKKI